MKKALLRLRHDIELSEYIYPVSLPQSCDDFEEFEDVYAAGNGQTSLNRPPRDLRLKQATFQVFSRQQCDHILRTEVQSSASIICGFSKVGRSLGNGDSGRKYTEIAKINALNGFLFKKNYRRPITAA